MKNIHVINFRGLRVPIAHEYFYKIVSGLGHKNYLFFYDELQA